MHIGERFSPSHRVRSGQPSLGGGLAGTPALGTSGTSAAAPEPVERLEWSDSASPHWRARLEATSEAAQAIAKRLPEHVAGQVIVKLRPEFAFHHADVERTVEEFARDYGAEVAHRFDIPKNMFKAFRGEMMVLDLPGGMSTAQAMAAMQEDQRVEYAASNDLLKLPQATAEPSHLSGAKEAPLNSQLWGLHNEGQTGGRVDADIDAPEAWGLERGRRQAQGGPLIAVIDSGINLAHEALAGNLWRNPGEIPGNGRDDDGNGVVDDVHGFNAIAKSGHPVDDNDHGTHCAATIGAQGENPRQLAGVMPEANLMGVKFLGREGEGTLADAVDSILYASRMGARITSNSWGGGGFNQALFDALRASPAMHVMAAGNERQDLDRRPAYPASYDLPNVIAVAATDHHDRLAGFSNFGARSVDLAAPGVGILSATAGNPSEYKIFDGTSMAAPHVAGAAGLIVSRFPEISNEELRSRLFHSVDKLDTLAGRVASGGRLNAHRALEDDRVPPAAPRDLSASAVSPGQMVVAFTAPGDDGHEGQASSYVVKMSTLPIVDGPARPGQASFDELPSLPVAWPAAAGEAERFTVKVPLSGREQAWHVAVKAVDNVGQASPIQSTRALVPAATVAFEETSERKSNNFRAERAWAKVEVQGRGWVWTDSPNGRYRDKEDVSLTSHPISLANLKGSTLVFDAKTDLEASYDNVFVEVGTPLPGQPNRVSWARVAVLNGTSDWSRQELDLSAFDGRDITLRFRLSSDDSVRQDGIYLDQIMIAGQAAP